MVNVRTIENLGMKVSLSLSLSLIVAMRVFVLAIGEMGRVEVNERR
jgi:hypothetical protein